jgi:hypothetical protein
MKLSVETRSPSEVRADILVAGRYADVARLPAELLALDQKLHGRLSTVLQTEKFEG